MKILAIGDIVGIKSVEYLREKLWRLRGDLGVDMVVANGENASDIHGVGSAEAKALIEAGVDLITLGNHTYGRRDICELLSNEEWVIRPANYPPLAPGAGYTIIRINGWRVLGINIMGTAFMESLACPFATVDRILDREKGNYDISVMDIHAESTSEKIALARYFDGRINVMFGTHTHVTTADERILPHGSGYITDVGMTGPDNSVIGAEIDAVIEKFRTKMPTRFKVADGNISAHAVLFDVDESAGRVRRVERIDF